MRPLTLALAPILMSYAFAQGGGTHPGPSTVERPLQPPGVALANDDHCASTTDVQVGAGGFAFDTSAATTDLASQSDAHCSCAGTTAFVNDIWFTWMPDSNGLATFVMEGQNPNFSEKIAVYAASGGCPSAPAIGCNDTWCFNLPAITTLAVSVGESYLVRLGGHPNVPVNDGPGVLSISMSAPGETCGYQEDSDLAAQIWGSTDPNLDLGVLRYFEAPGGTDLIHAIRLEFGWVDTPGFFNDPDLTGAAITVALWDDPTDDSDPTDADLVWSGPGTISKWKTGEEVVFPLPQTRVSGGYFAGFVIDLPFGGGFPAPLDPLVSGDTSWSVSSLTGFDFDDLGNNSFPPGTLYSKGGGTGGFLIRAVGVDDGCLDLGTTFCPSLPNSTGNVGAIAATGNPYASANIFTLRASALPTDQFGFFLASQSWSNGTSVGQGVLCLDLPIGRFNAQVGNTRGAGAFEIDVDLTSVPTSPPQPVLSGETWAFQCWHRDGSGVSNFTRALEFTFL